MIEIKPKPCKGTGKAKGFNSCGKPTTWRKYGLCMDCYREWLLTTSEGQETIMKSTIQAKKKVIHQSRKEHRELKEKHKSMDSLIQEARKPFQQFIRLRDINRLCISCGRDSETWDGGHFYKAELYSGLIFDEDNVHKQCKYCNKYLGGNETGFRAGLEKRYGREFVEDLDRRAIFRKNYKFTREELNEIKKLYQTKIKSYGSIKRDS